METVEILYYKWCLFYGKEFKEDHIYIKGMNDDTLIYCKVERLIKTKGAVIEKIETRTVPVKRSEMEVI